MNPKQREKILLMLFDSLATKRDDLQVTVVVDVNKLVDNIESFVKDVRPNNLYTDEQVDAVVLNVLDEVEKKKVTLIATGTETIPLSAIEDIRARYE